MRIILMKLRASRGHLDGLRPEELFPHDPDHYGGLAATDELARGAQVHNELIRPWALDRPIG